MPLYHYALVIWSRSEISFTAFHMKLSMCFKIKFIRLYCRISFIFVLLI
nr:MAG TPA: hypothetical protein [Caudoviricetes sp.]